MKKVLVYVYNSFYEFLRKISNYSISYGARKENRIILKALKQNKIAGNAKILDVGCGYGRLLEIIQKEGYAITGVDSNIHIVQINKLKEYNCITVDEFKNTSEKYELVLMSHVIEHLGPSELLTFMDYYLDFLGEKGKLIIITPVLTKQFTIDFDHIKPYSPLGINMVFSGENQVQYYSRNKLSIKTIKYIKVPYNHLNISYKTQTATTIKKGFIDFFFLSLFYLSISLISVNTSWMGIYNKEKSLES